MSIISTLSSSQISSLLAAEQKTLEQPITIWDASIQNDQTMISAWGKVGGAMSALNTALSGISKPTTLNNRGVTSSDTSVATATIQQNAPVGTYNLSGVKLAKAQTVYSSSFSSASAPIGSGSGALTIKFGSGSTETVNVSSANTTLQGIAQAINNVSSGQVTASVIGGSSGDRLVLTGNQTGSSQSFSVSGSGALSGFSYSASGSANTMILGGAARNATLSVNGVPVSSNTNTLKSAIPSGSVTLAGSGSTTLSVAVNSNTLSTAVSSVISKLNSAVSTIHKETAYAGSGSSGSGSSKKQNGPLLGNFSASDMADQLLSAVSNLYASTSANGSSGLSGADIGISISKTGAVTFDSSKFASAYQSNPTAVETLVSQLYTNVNAISSVATNSAGSGTVGTEKKSLTNDINSLQNEITQQNKFVASQMQDYQSQYAQMESMQSSLSTASQYLSLLGSGSGSSKSGG